MNINTFRQTVLARGRQLPTEFLEDAIGMIADREGNVLYEDHVREAIRWAGRFQVHAGGSKDQHPQGGPGIVSHQELLSSDYLAAAILPWVERLREEIWEGNRPPFKSGNAAARWLVQKCPADHGMRGPIPFTFPGKAGGIGLTYAGKDPQLKRLADEISRIANATGFDKWTLPAFILMGIEPILPRFAVSWSDRFTQLPDGRRLVRKALRIDINAADLTLDELRTIYDTQRRALQIRRKKALSGGHVKLYKFIRERGGPPEKGSKAFWEQAMQEWNCIEGNPRYKTWEALYKKYKHVEDRLTGLYFKEE